MQGAEAGLVVATKNGQSEGEDHLTYSYVLFALVLSISVLNRRSEHSLPVVVAVVTLFLYRLSSRDLIFIIVTIWMLIVQKRLWPGGTPFSVNVKSSLSIENMKVKQTAKTA